jgi:SAM-dependent methyltransferase
MPNEEQVEFWNAGSAEKWVRHQEKLDGLFTAYAAAVVDAARLRSGASVLDVGTGCGATSLEVAKRVGSGGRVVGVDISVPMLARARQRAEEAGVGHVRFELGDAQTCSLEQGGYDAVISRFGVMFFDDPTAAFANLRGALRSSGRLAFACWQRVADNPWVSAPIAAIESLVPVAPIDGPGPGPFSFADVGRVRGILTDAGFGSIDVSPLRIPLSFGRTAEEAARALILLGPSGRALASADDATKELAVQRVRDALPAGTAGVGVVLESNGWLVTASSGG